MEWLGPALTIGGLAVALVGTAQGRVVLGGVGKMAASTGFIVAAMSWGATGSAYGATILVGLALAWVGDLALISSQKRWFLLGLVSFLLGHVAYVAAFLQHPPRTGSLVLAAVGAALFAAVVLRWLWPKAGSMRWPVVAYVLVICTMMATAIGIAEVHWSIPTGAVLFGASDLFVARQRFVQAALVNRFVGLPLYYAGQLLLAYSVA